MNSSRCESHCARLDLVERVSTQQNTCKLMCQRVYILFDSNNTHFRYLRTRILYYMYGISSLHVVCALCYLAWPFLVY